MNQYQQKTLDSASVLYKGITETALEGNGSPRNAIKAFCLHCVGYQREDVKGCTAYGCPLYAFRPYQKDTESLGEASE